MQITLYDLFEKMQQQLEQKQAVVNKQLIIELINRIRPADSQNPEEIQLKFNALIQALLRIPTAAATLQHFLVRLINQYKQTSLYAESGILPLDGFWNQLMQRMGAYLLPVIQDQQQLRYLIGEIFYRSICPAGLSCLNCSVMTTVYKLSARAFSRKS